MFWVFSLLVVAPLVELYVLVRVGSAIGVLPALVVLVACAALGAWLVKHEGLRVWRRFQQRVAAGEVPEREVADGVLLLVAGALLLVPGFVSDVIGLLLLLPPVRAVVRRWVLRRRPGRMRVVRATYGGRMSSEGTTTVTIIDASSAERAEWPGRPTGHEIGPVVDAGEGRPSDDGSGR